MCLFNSIHLTIFNSVSGKKSMRPSVVVTVFDPLASSKPYWIERRWCDCMGHLPAICRKDQRFFSPTGSYNAYSKALVLVVSYALCFLFVYEFEVPYIWTHKRDYISYFNPQEMRTRCVSKWGKWSKTNQQPTQNDNSGEWWSSFAVLVSNFQ